MSHLARYISPTLAEIIGIPADPDRLEELESEGFVEFVQSEEPETDPGQRIELSYSLQDGKVYQIWTVVDDESFYHSQIDTLKADLSSSDYKVMKCYEASLVGENLPYDIQILHSERQSIRDEINTIEQTLANL